MAAKKRKKTARPRPPDPFGLRLREALKLREWTEADLLREVHLLVPGPEYDRLRAKSLTQQMINHIMNFKAARSYFTPFLAAALDVSCLWLAFGVGGIREKHVAAGTSPAMEPAVGGVSKSRTRSAAG